MSESTQASPKRGGVQRSTHYRLRLFVAGDEPNSASAKASLHRICSTYLSERDFRIEIIDVLRDSRPAREESILVTPALIVQAEGTRTVVFGNLAEPGKVLAALQMGSERS